MKILDVELRLKTKNSQNVKAKNHKVAAGIRKAQRRKVLELLPRVERNPVVLVTFTRHSAGEMDDDGLRAALKTVRDAVCSRLRIDDGSPLIAFEYLQAKCPRGETWTHVRVEPYPPLWEVEMAPTFDVDVGERLNSIARRMLEEEQGLLEHPLAPPADRDAATGFVMSVEQKQDLEELRRRTSKKRTIIPTPAVYRRKV